MLVSPVSDFEFIDYLFACVSELGKLMVKWLPRGLALLFLRVWRLIKLSMAVSGLWCGSFVIPDPMSLEPS